MRKKNHSCHEDKKKIAPSGGGKKINPCLQGDNFFEIFRKKKFTLVKVTKKKKEEIHPPLSDEKKPPLTKLPTLPGNLMVRPLLTESPINENFQLISIKFLGLYKYI